MNTITRGALSGLGATVPMSAVMAAGKFAGLLPATPPKQITANAARKAGAEPEEASDSGFHASWVAAHLGYGVAMGVCYSLLRPMFPKADWKTGVAFGGVVWAVNYLGMLPALGLFPPPKDSSHAQTLVMITAHAVFGASLEAGQQRL